MWENIEYQIFNNRKKEKTIRCQNQIIILYKDFHRKFISCRNNKNSNTNE